MRPIKDSDHETFKDKIGDCIQMKTRPHKVAFSFVRNACFLLNAFSTLGKVGLIFLYKRQPHRKPQRTTTPSVTFSQLLFNQTRPNSVHNLISTKLNKIPTHISNWKTTFKISKWKATIKISKWKNTSKISKWKVTPDWL